MTSEDATAQPQDAPVDQEPVLMALFFVPLPEAVGFPEGETFGRVLPEVVPGLAEAVQRASADGSPTPGAAEGHLFVSVRFWHVQTPGTGFQVHWAVLDDAMRRTLPEEMHARLIGEVMRSYPGAATAHHTVAAMATPLVGGEGTDAVRAAFDRCLEYLQALRDAYMGSTHWSLAPITREVLPFVVPFVVGGLGEGGTPPKGVSLFFLHQNVPGEVVPTLLDREQLDLLETRLGAAERGHPMTLAGDLAEEATLVLERYGDYRQAVILLQTYTEVLLDAVLTLLLWDEGENPEKAAKEVFKDGLTKRVNTHYAPRLGGQWNTRGRGPIKEWAEKVMHLRGRVVHAGYRPTLDEAGAAKEAATELYRFVGCRLVEKRTRYSRVALTVLGKSGLEQRGAWTGQVARFGEANLNMPWLDDYVAWRDAFIAARA